MPTGTLPKIADDFLRDDGDFPFLCEFTGGELFHDVSCLECANFVYTKNWSPQNFPRKCSPKNDQ